MSVLDAGVDAVSAVVDAGIAAVTGGLPPLGAPPASPGDWFHAFLTAGAAAGAVVSAVALIFNGLWVNKRIERFKHELGDILEKRKLRAEYIRGQIENLYGPLAFLVEASERHIGSRNSILLASSGRDDKSRSPGPEAEARPGSILSVANDYIPFVLENNLQAEKLLRAGWGWLDRDDVDLALTFITDIARNATEFTNDKGRLPPAMYFEDQNNAALKTPSILPSEFVERIKRKLGEKQRELAGLTGAVPATPPGSASTVPPALPTSDVPSAPPAPKTE